MKTNLLLMLWVAGCQPLPSGSGRIIHQQRSVAAFHTLEVNSALHADVTAGKAQSLTVSGDDNLVGYVETKVSGGSLIVELKPGVQGSNDDLLISITVPSLDSITANGAAEVTARSLTADRLRLVASGASQLSATGNAAVLDADSSGSSDLRARGLTAADVTLTASGASSGEVCAAESLELHLSGASRAVYGCQPKTVRGDDITGASTAQAE
jgi:hypothetical protein